MFERLKTVERAVLLWSGGLDSTLVLALLREQPIDFDIVQSRDFWTKAQRKRSDDLIKEWNLKVFSYPPIFTNLIGDGENLAAVFEYAVGGAKALITKDIIPGNRCYEELAGMTMQNAPIKWDLCITGLRSEDRHWSLNRPVVSEKETTSDGLTFYHPLFDYSREDVKRELRARGLDDTEATDAEDTGNLAACTLCLHGVETFCPKTGTVIPPVNWQPKVNLANFQQV